MVNRYGYSWANCRLLTFVLFALDLEQGLADAYTWLKTNHAQLQTITQNPRY